MASLTNRPNGHRWIQFVDGDGRRQTIRLGKVPKKAAETVLLRVEELLAAKLTGTPPSRDLALWLADVESELRNKLAAVRLCEARESADLGPFVAAYVASRTDVKPATKEVWRQGEVSLIEFFGAGCPLRSVTPGCADRYKLSLVGKGLAPMTVRKRLQFATMIFRAAVRRRLITENPFAGVSVKATMANRQRFITREEADRLLNACPNHHWRAIVALARYGGLRCPSEVLSLRWQDIDWETGRIVVTSPKTEHHPGKASRTIPLFPELRPILEESFKLAPDGAVYVVDERMRAGALGKSGWRNCNLRTQFERIVKRAGLTPWPRLFHNLRSSRETELAERFPAHVVCSWLGNSLAVAHRHYLQVTEDHFACAISPGHDAQQKAKQKAKQSAAVLGRNEPQAETRAPGFSARNNTLHHCATIKTDGEGFETVSTSPRATNDLWRSLESGEAESEAISTIAGLDLVAVAWPRLPAEVQQRILDLVRRFA